MLERCISGTSIMNKYDITWEIKTGRGKFIQGATHSPKEKSALNLIQVLWDCHWDKTLDDILADRKFISEINICVFLNMLSVCHVRFYFNIMGTVLLINISYLSKVFHKS